MSLHYTVTLNLRLKHDLTVIEISALDYILNGNGGPPTALPKHEFFKNGIPKYLHWQSYMRFPTGSWRSEFWRGVNAPGSSDADEVNYGVNLLLPGQKLEGALSELPFFCWLATISSSVGYVGAATCEDDSIGMPIFILFIHDQALKISSLSNDIIMESAEGISG